MTLEFAAAPTTVVATADNGRVKVVVPTDGTAYRVDDGHRQRLRGRPVPTDDASTRTITARTDNGSITVRPAA